MPARRRFMRDAALTGLSLLGPGGAAEAGSTGGPRREPRAKAIIQIWMWGGPSHLDTFDPKPDAGPDFCGPLGKPIRTNVSGLRISEQLPMLAKQADKYSVLRSMTHGVNAHETASYLVQTGREVDSRRVYPSIGSVIAKLRGYEHGYDGAIPPYVVLTASQGRFSKAGFLGRDYKPFITGGDPNQDPFLVEGFVVDGVDRRRQLQRRRLLGAFSSLRGAAPDRIEARREGAYRQILGEDLAVFDLGSEPTRIRESYGRTWFGQACLMARRLVEKGVPYVTINYPGWDTHKNHFRFLQRLHPDLDRGMATLLQDLSDRGLLDQTIVWWGGEFGRTPRIQWEAPWNGGRGHWGACFSTVVAGGGFEGGTVVGASNRTGEEVSDRPIHPQDLLGTYCELMGIDPDARLPNPEGLEVPVMAPASSAGRLHEIARG